MYLDRLNCVSIAQKIAARHTITEREYIAAYLALLDDKQVYNHKDLPAMLDHLRIIAEDTLHSPWQAIRAWTQRVFDKIEKKKLTWDNKQGLHNERSSFSFTSAYHTNTTERDTRTQNTYQDNKTRTRLEAEPHERPCPVYNSGRRCNQPQHHQDGPQDVVHACAYCFRVTQTYLEHTEQQCRRKIRNNTTKN